MPEFNVCATAQFALLFLTSDTMDVGVVADDVTESEGYVRDYILAHADSAYVNIDPNSSFVFDEQLKVSRTFADGTLYGGEHTWDDFYSSADATYPLVFHHEMVYPLWDVDQNSDYYVAWVSTYHSTDGWDVTDVSFIRDNVFGDVQDGCYIDYDTGLVYVPKDLYSSRHDVSSDTASVDDIVELVTSNFSAMDDFGDVSLPVNVTVSSNLDRSIFMADAVIDSLLVNPYIAIPLVQDSSDYETVDWRDITVYVNGVLGDSGRWSYSEDDGVLLLSYNPASVQTVNVSVCKQSLADQVVMAMTGDMRDTDFSDCETQSILSHATFAGADEADQIVANIDNFDSLVSFNAVNDGISTHSTPVSTVGNICYTSFHFSDVPKVGANIHEKGTCNEDKVYTIGDITIGYGDATVSGSRYPYVVDTGGGEDPAAAQTGKLIYNTGSITGSTELFQYKSTPTWTWWVNWARTFTLSDGTTMTTSDFPPDWKNGDAPMSFYGACIHPDTYGYLFPGDYNKNPNPGVLNDFMIKVMYVKSTDDSNTKGYMLLGFITGTVWTQQSAALYWLEWDAEPKKGKLRVHKSSASKCTEGNKNYSLAGAEFTAVGSDGKEYPLGAIDESGYTQWVEIPADKSGAQYHIREDKNPKGFKINTEGVNVVGRKVSRPFHKCNFAQRGRGR